MFGIAFDPGKLSDLTSYMVAFRQIHQLYDHFLKGFKLMSIQVSVVTFVIQPVKIRRR
ncbi:hypothetical protein F0726_02407 [Acidithiobacillus caldus]|nr:hypothetical protein F0726_02407 [Acidithiobacillus caldus]